MRPENTLRRRVLAACVALAVIVGGVFAAAAYIIIELIEHELIDVRLTRAAEQFLELGPGSPSVVLPADLRFAEGAQVPEELRDLKAGTHELELGGRALHVLIGRRGERPYAVIDDVTDFERIENIGFAGLWIAFFSGVLLALAIARASVNAIVAPLTALARTVQDDRLTAHSEFLGAGDEIGVLARAFEARTSELRASLTRERLFTADVSHELRTPLSVILGAAEVLIARLDERPELRTAAERVRRTAADTAVRVSALLQLARAPANVKRTRLPLRPLVEQEIEHCRPMLEGKPVALTFDAPDEVWVYGASDLAAIAVGNLLRNACHFTQRGSIKVTLRADSLTVADTGPGVPPGLRATLFEPFVKGPDEATAGSGLGLSIVKRVAHHLGWTVRLDDARGSGSSFTVTFEPRAAS